MKIEGLKNIVNRQIDPVETTTLTVRVSGPMFEHVWKPLSEENPDKFITELMKEALSLRLLADRIGLVFKDESGQYVSAKKFLWGQD